MKTSEILRQMDEVIQYFIGHENNEPKSEFCNNVDKLINLKSDLPNGATTKNEASLNLDVVTTSSSGKFGFLYWLESDSNSSHGRCKWIKADNIDQSCKKFLKNATKTLQSVDYEVQLGDKYIDISERPDFKSWI